MKRGIFIVSLAVILRMVYPGEAYGTNATMVDGVGAKSMGMGGAFTAVADDTSSMYHNPAGITFQDGGTFEFGVALMYPRATYDESGNENVQAKDLIWSLPQVGYMSKKEGSKLSYGLGIFTVAGLEAKYDLTHATFGAQPYESYLALTKIVSTAAYQLTPKLSLGAGLNIGVQEFDLKLPYTIQTGALAGNTVLVDIKTDGWGYGGIFSLLYKMNDKTTFGLSYTTKMDIDLQGEIPLTISGLNAYYDVGIDYQWPQTLASGIAHRPSAKFLISSDVVWVDRSTASDVLTLKLSEGTNATVNALNNGSPNLTDVLPLDWGETAMYFI